MKKKSRRPIDILNWYKKIEETLKLKDPVISITIEYSFYKDESTPEKPSTRVAIYYAESLGGGTIIEGQTFKEVHEKLLIKLKQKCKKTESHLIKK